MSQRFGDAKFAMKKPPYFEGTKSKNRNFATIDELLQTVTGLKFKDGSHIFPYIQIFHNIGNTDMDDSLRDSILSDLEHYEERINQRLAEEGANYEIRLGVHKERNRSTDSLFPLIAFKFDHSSYTGEDGNDLLNI